MNGLEEARHNAMARELVWQPLSWLGTIRPTSANDEFALAIFASPPRGCKHFMLDFHSDHISKCTDIYVSGVLHQK